ncbi:iron transporter [Haloarcula amylovorans]|uniref:iron transporter n=1 Tax=Haloarcula amylovorans TaxID=2562280 RepID=UPI00142F95AB|nr:iron transporter [Halomicroarcula amylolytica]
MYVPAVTATMQMIGMKKAGRLMVSLSYTHPHPFFVVTGTRTNEATIQSDDTMHLMAIVHDMKTGAVAPQVEPTITITKDGEEVALNQPWPMLSQTMGFHYGDNIALSGEGSYTFDVSVNAAKSVLSTDLAAVFTEQQVSFETQFDPATAASIEDKPTGDDHLTAGALSPMSMGKMSISQQPSYDDLPVATDTQYTDDLGVAVAIHEQPTALGFGGGDHALIVATQTRYNRYPTGFMNVAATVTRDGQEVFTGDLTSAVDGEFGHYYGAGTPPLESGDEVVVEFSTPPQGARHIGYETAFMDLESQTFTI